MPVNKKFIISLQGKSFVTYEGLLDLAHQNQLKSIEVELIQYPNKENGMMAICRATAMTESHKFIDFGDASPQSVNSKIAPHIIRMASTRAKARTLRDLTNVGMTAIEELNTEDTSNSHDMDEYNVDSNIPMEDPPTKRQIETIEKLSNSSNSEIDYNTLNKRTAGSLISKMLDEKYKRH